MEKKGWLALLEQPGFKEELAKTNILLPLIMGGRVATVRRFLIIANQKL